MRRRLPRYFLLSFFSFVFFSVLFQTIANAQEVTTQPSLQNPLVDEPTQTPPTPTIYMAQPVLQKQSSNTNPPVALPTPTIYIAQAQTQNQTPTTTVSPTPQPTQQVYNTTELPAVSPTAVPTVTPTAVPTTEPTTQTGPVDLDSLFSQYSAQYGVSEDELKKIAQCESGFNTNSDTGLYAGMFQFSASTWESERGVMGLDPNPDLRKDPGEAIRTTAFMLSQGQQNAWPNCH